MFIFVSKDILVVKINEIESEKKIVTLPPSAIPDTAPRASKRPTARYGAFGKESISSVTMPA